jgi:repressor of nif and glnA expression
MRKFGNTANKVKAILSVIRDGEKIKGKDIALRLKRRGYDAREGNINMFIYHYMLYKYLDRERVNGTNYYSLV